MGLDDLFQDFQKFNFPHVNFPGDASIVYVIGIRKPVKGFFPFYVGESGRQLGRMGDYVTASFKAPTDFHVGEAIRFFQSQGLEIEVRYKVFLKRKDEEKSLQVEIAKRSIPLLKLASYDPKKTPEEQERQKEEERQNVHKFCREFVDTVDKL
jgi:hypothetical protein